MTKIINKHNSGGFTLPEMLLVMGMSSFIGILIFGSLFSSKNIYQDSVNRTEAFQQIRQSMTLLCRDIQNVARSSDAKFVGEDSNQRDTLTFSHFSKNIPRNISGGNSFVTIRYSVASGENESLILVKTVESAENPYNRRVITICKNIKGINFRYLKDNVWHENWDSSSLPDAVEISLIIDKAKIKTQDGGFKTIVSIIS